MIDVQNGHQFVGILGLTSQVRRAQDDRPIANLCWQHQNRGRDRNRARPRENEMAPRRDLH
jgi:hypothetical protein